MNEQQKQIQEKCISFSVRCVKLHRYLEKQREHNLSSQIERSATSIGALYSEAMYAESDLDFVHKLQIAQKEGSETIYWLKVLHRSEWITQEQYDSLFADVDELMRILTSTIVSIKRRINGPKA